MSWFDLPLAELRSHRTATQEPADLDAFWEERLREASAASRPTTFVRHLPEVYGSTPVWDVEFSGGRGDRIRAWYIRPAEAPEATPLPTIVTYIGYGGGRGVPWEHLGFAALGFACLVMDTRGQGSRWAIGATGDGDNLGPELSTVMTRGLLDARHYYYTRLYVDAVRALHVATHDLPGVDASRIAVYGGSQGGGLALAAAALAPDLVKAVVAEVPFLCDMARAIRITDENPYAELAHFMRQHINHADAAHRTLSYVDNALLATRITAPVAMSVGLMDQVCPPSTVFAAFNAIAGPDKHISVQEFGDHAGTRLHNESTLLFLRQRLGAS